MMGLNPKRKWLKLSVAEADLILRATDTRIVNDVCVDCGGRSELNVSPAIERHEDGCPGEARYIHVRDLLWRAAERK